MPNWADVEKSFPKLGPSDWDISVYGRAGVFCILAADFSSTR